MATFDIIVLVLLAAGAFSGYKKGVVKQLLGLVGVFIGTYWAYRASAEISIPGMAQFNMEPLQSRIITFIILLIITYILILVLAMLVNKMLRLAMLGWLNRLLGMVIGVTTVSIFICVFIFVLDSLSFIGNFGEGIKASASYPIFSEITRLALPFLNTYSGSGHQEIRSLFSNI